MRNVTEVGWHQAERRLGAGMDAGLQVGDPEGCRSAVLMRAGNVKVIGVELKRWGPEAQIFEDRADGVEVWREGREMAGGGSPPPVPLPSPEGGCRAESSSRLIMPWTVTTAPNLKPISSAYRRHSGLLGF